MKLLDLSNPFQFTLRDQDGNETILKGTFRTYTKEEQSEAKKKYDEYMKGADEVRKLGRKLERTMKQLEIKEKLEDYDAVDKLYTEQTKLEDKIEALGKKFDGVENDGLKDRFEKCLGGDQRDEIMQLAEQVGYDVVYAKISEGVQEGKSKS